MISCISPRARSTPSTRVISIGSRRLLVGAIVDARACIGHIDCYNQPVEIRSFLSQHWIRTCFFFLRPGRGADARTMVSIADGRQFFSGDPSSPFRAAAPLCATYRQVYSRLADGTRHRTRRDMAFLAGADARGPGVVRAEGALHPQRAYARDSFARSSAVRSSM